ncbi:MAG TPA: radical SAM protein, partial [Kofleriaceae bacterium]|nr:radical SAM protein [Kofleriaceae bacterium]
MNLPGRLHLEITNRCNSRCQTCIRTLRPEPARDMTLADIERYLDGLPGLDSVALQVNGEPFLHRELPAIVRMLVARRIRVELNTNGTMLVTHRAAEVIAAGLHALNVSIDAMDPCVYADLRGIDAHAKVVRGLARFLRYRGRSPARPRVALWMTANRRNLRDLPRLVDLAARVGAEEVHLQRLVWFEELLAREEESLHGRLDGGLRAVIAEAEVRATLGGVVLRACGRHGPTAMLERPADPEPWR